MSKRILAEIEALQRLASDNPDDALAQASIAGQINALTWANTSSEQAAIGMDSR